MKRQSINNAAYMANNGKEGFFTILGSDEVEACRQAKANRNISRPDIVRAGMEALGIKPLIQDDIHNK